MKRYILTRQQKEVLEALLAEHGQVVNSQQVAQQVSHLSEQSKRRFIVRLVEAGWLVRIKQGLYQIADIGSLGTLTLSRLTIAQLLVPESYVSFQTALQQHGLYDQGLSSVGSVSLHRRAAAELEGTRYTYVTTQPRYFFGSTETSLDGQGVHIATAEKAILDLLQFQRTQATVDLALELLRERPSSLDLERLTEYALQLPGAVQQVVAFLLETAGQVSLQKLADLAKGTSVTWLTPQSSVYNSRWRVYIDPYFTTANTHA